MEFGGPYQQQQESFRNLLLVLLMAVFLVFTVLLIKFRLFYEPLVIVSCAILALFGTVLALLITATSLNIVSFLSAIIGVGILSRITAFSCWILWTICAPRGCPWTRHPSVSGHRRLRPVLMTSLAASIGMLPLAYGVGGGADTSWTSELTILGVLLIVLAAMEFAFPKGKTA